MRRTKVRVAILALVSVIVGILLLWWATGVGAPWNAVVGTLATITVTIGVVNLVSDFFLQNSISNDLISLIQSDRRLIEAGIDGLTRIEDTDWTELIAGGDTVECAVLDPSQFKSLIWPRLLDAAKSEVTAIEIAFADHEAASIQELASRLGADTEDYLRSQLRVEADVEREWKAMKQNSSSKCTLTLRRMTQPTTLAYVKTRTRCALLLEPLDRRTGIVECHVLTFQTRRKGHSYAPWLTDQTAALRKTFTAPTYSDVRNDVIPGEEI